MSEPGSRLPTIEAARVRLRWLEDDDVSSLFKVFSDRTVMRYWSSPPFESIDAAVRLLEEIRELFAADTLFQWGIALKSSDEVIGTCTLAGIDRTHQRCELGFALHPSHWGQGLASEAVRVLLSWAFDELDMNRIEADIDPRNEPSIRLVERLGFRREGLLRERYHVNGEIQDSLIYGLLRRETDLAPPSGA